MTELIILTISTILFVVSFCYNFNIEDLKVFIYGIIFVMMFLWFTSYMNKTFPQKPIDDKQFKIIQQLITKQ